ncbi:hypothetical protein M0534_08905 [Methylonatrum kenyense]|uniref:hypothetical protein n=1 Tax=Methylonatrum kenyense TaxID=455253 RepID=UPI0020BD74BE|nr:hypothetical protein [Methylonatrum kenyense]MCK8516442.1 hypothetical protein [Methylonatrum kenyense]
MHRVGGFRLTAVLLLALLLAACGESDTYRDLSPAESYEEFFTQLGRGNTNSALEKLAPEGALGDTFRGGAYYMMARNVSDQIEDHGRLREVQIDREDAWSEEEVMIDGRLIFDDGKEMPVAIRFTRENDRWVGQL